MLFWAFLSGQLFTESRRIVSCFESHWLWKIKQYAELGQRRIVASWQTTTLIAQWSQHVESLPEWQRHEYEDTNLFGSRCYPLASDLEKLSKQTLSSSRWACYAAVIFGVVGKVGEINGQRIALPQAF